MNETHEGVSGYTISTGFHKLMGDQRTPEFWDVTVSKNESFPSYPLENKHKWRNLGRVE